ncbi:MAG: hypothetical protein ACI4EI_10255 [Muricoprocola sp.]
MRKQIKNTKRGFLFTLVMMILAAFGSVLTVSADDCQHPMEYREYQEGHYSSDKGTHYQWYTCKQCGDSKLIDWEHGEKCTLTNCEKYNLYNDYHSGTCTVCDSFEYQDCTYKYNYSKSDADASGHMVSKTCTVCGGQGIMSGASTLRESHSYKNNVCTKCGFKRIIPGSVSITSAKQSGKVKAKKVSVYAHWEKNNRGGYSWIPAKKYTNYEYKISVKLKKAARTDYYVISPSKDWRSSAYKLYTSKTSCTYTYLSTKKKASKVTLYVTPVSTSGHEGKTVKKVVQLKN